MMKYNLLIFPSLILSQCFSQKQLTIKYVEFQLQKNNLYL